MKLSEKSKAVFEWIIAIILLLICSKMYFGQVSLSPLKAHEKSERTYHYGPSEIIDTVKLDDMRIYLCRYKDWFSADTVKKQLLLWYPSSGVGGEEIDYSKQVSYKWNGQSLKEEKMLLKVYGYVNDSEIITMSLGTKENTDIYTYDLDENGMFIFSWAEEYLTSEIRYLRGKDKSGNIIYEEEIWD